MSCERLGRMDWLAVLDAAGVRAQIDSVQVERIRSGNSVYRIRCDDGTLFLKIPAKDLEAWSNELDGAAVKVEREAAAAACLRRHRVAAFETVTAETGVANPVGRPYLLTRAVDGTAFRSLMEPAPPTGWEGIVAAVGSYLRCVHNIEFEATGYLVSADGPAGPTPPAPPRPAHDPLVAQRDALHDLERAGDRIDPGVKRSVAARLSCLAERTAPQYEPPRFVIGGFHTNHPHLARSGDAWTVVGCIDFEVASGGRVVDDIVTFAVGLAAELPVLGWWAPLFDGYGGPPPFEAVRDELLGSCAYLLGDCQDLDEAYRSLLDATSWRELFVAISRVPLT